MTTSPRKTTGQSPVTVETPPVEAPPAPEVVALPVELFLVLVQFIAAQPWGVANDLMNRLYPYAAPYFNPNGGQGYMSTLADFRTLASASLGLMLSGAEQALIDKWANDGVVELLRQTDCKISIADTFLTSGAGDYDLPVQLMALRRVVDANNLPIEQYTPTEILELRRASPSMVATTYIYAVDGSVLMVYPTPGKPDLLKLYYIARPTAMSDPTHDPSTTTYGGIPLEYHRAIELYILWKGAQLTRDASAQMGEPFRQQFVAEIAQIRRDIRGRAGWKLAPAHLRIHKQFVSSDPART